MSFAQTYAPINSSAARLACPDDMKPHVEAIFRGEYDVPGLEFSEPPHILDIGANVGGFAVWASRRWPGARVDCYEPNPKALEYLRRNRKLLHPASLIEPVAVTRDAGRRVLHFGRNNLGEASFHDLGEQREEGVEVECVAASSLSDCDILKLDVEGEEWPVIQGCLYKPRAIMLKFHSEQDRKLIDEWLADPYEFRSYQLVRGVIHRADRGTLCYVRQS